MDVAPNGRRSLKARAARILARDRIRFDSQSIIRNAHQKGRDASWAKDTLKALEASVRAFQNHRQLILDQLKSTKER
jgi:hypothetical protein